MSPSGVLSPTSEHRNDMANPTPGRLGGPPIPGLHLSTLHAPSLGWGRGKARWPCVCRDTPVCQGLAGSGARDAR